MAIFCLKKIDKPELVGKILKKQRLNHKLSILEISKLSHIPRQYILAIEKSKFNKLPPTKAHQIAYIKKYANVLGLNSITIAEQFLYESGLENYTMQHPKTRMKIRQINCIPIWIKRITITSILLIFIGYLGWQVNGILKPPKLVILSPVEGYISETIKTTVKGEAEKEVTLQINGKEVSIDDKGNFETEINLSKGVNSITITATKKHGKTTTITKHIILKNNNNQLLNLNK